MTARPPRDVREDAKQALTARLRYARAPAPSILAAERLVVLDGAHIGLVDTTPPLDPNADWHPPAGTVPAAIDTPSPGLAEYLAARGKTPQEPTDG